MKGIEIIFAETLGSSTERPFGMLHVEWVLVKRYTIIAN